MPVESAREGDRAAVKALRDLERAAVGRGELFGLAVRSAAPDRADRVHDVARRQTSGTGRLRIARLTAPEAGALLEDLVSTCPPDRTADPGARDERLVGRIDDRVDSLLGEIADDERDHNRASSPTVSPCGRSRTFSSASSTPGTKALRDVVSCRIVSVSPGAAEHDFLVRHESGEANRMDRRIGPHPRRGRLRRARRRVTLRLRVELDDLRSREHLRGLLGEAHHQHRTHREVRSVEARDARIPGCEIGCVEVEAGRSDDDRDAGLEATGDVLPHGIRGVKSTAASHPRARARVRRPRGVLPRRAQARGSCRPFRRRRTGRLSSGRLLEERRVHALDGFGKPGLIWPDPGDRQPVGSQ